MDLHLGRKVENLHGASAMGFRAEKLHDQQRDRPAT
jgi:hypothetical protein